MTPPDFSVLLLAWDEADPRVAVLGGAALPPTRPLVYRLAAGQPVLAVYPHLPAPEEAPIEALPASPSAAPETGPNSDPPTADDLINRAAVSGGAASGIRQIPGRLQPEADWPTPSYLVGLGQLTEADSARIWSVSGRSETVSTPLPPARSQWPTGAHAPQPASWAAPAAPYLGAGAPPAPLPPTVREAADLAQAAVNWPAGFSPLVTSPSPEEPVDEVPATQLPAKAAAIDPDAAPSGGLRSASFDEPTEEIGPAEAHDLSAPEDDLTLDEPPAAAPAVPTPPAVAPPLEPAVRTPLLDGLNFRMIQYARQAAQLVRDHAEFGVIYAPNWPAWLAALEIRNSTGQPLVLYATSLAADFTSPAERGWLLEVERMALRRAHLILVPDEDVRQRLRAQYAATIGEIRVVPAANEEAIREALRELAHRPGRTLARSA